MCVYKYKRQEGVTYVIRCRQGILIPTAGVVNTPTKRCKSRIASIIHTCSDHRRWQYRIFSIGLNLERNV